MCAQLRRHLIAVTVVLMMAAGGAWKITSSTPVYLESANVIFATPGPNPYSDLGPELIPAANLMAKTMLSPAYEQQIRQAGGTAQFDLELVNLYNEQFPYYDDPYVTVTAQSNSQQKTDRTFQIVIRTLQALVRARQTQAGVRPWAYFGTHVVADTGPLPQPGSRKRTLASLAVLTLIVLFLVAGFLDRRPVWATLRDLRRSAARLAPKLPRGA
jgi:hypothetical protein